MASITTRQTAGGGATVKGTPLTNTEMDTNLINLNVGQTTNVDITGGTISGVSSLGVSGDLMFSGDARRITGDLNNATHSNRVLFQTNITDGSTSIGAIPNGTSTTAQTVVYNSSDADNSSFITMRISSTDARFASGILGTGSYLPLTFYAGGSERVRISNSGNVGIGTNDPQFVLDVNGTSRFSNTIRIADPTTTNIASLSFYDSATYLGGIDQVSSLAVANPGLMSIVTSSLSFNIGGQERGRILNTGFWGIGTINPQAVAHISSTTSDTALLITQTGSGNAFVVEDSASPDSTPFVINSSGQVIQGYTTAISGGGGLDTPFQLHATSSAGANLFRWSADVTSSVLGLNKSRSGTIGSYTIVQNGDLLGVVRFSGDDGTTFIRGAEIKSEVDGTPGTNDMPGRLVFSTTPDGSNTPVERMRIGSTGTIGIGIPNFPQYNLLSSKNITGAASAYGIVSQGNIQPDVTDNAFLFAAGAFTAASTFTLTNLYHYRTGQGTFGLGSVVTNQYAFSANVSLTGATNNYGFYSSLAAATGRWNFYAAGTADNYFAGRVLIGQPINTTSLGYTQGVQLYGTSGTLGQFRWSTDNGSPELVSSKGRGSSSSPTIVANNDGLWLGRFAGWDGAAFIEAARISVSVDGTPGVNDMPGRIVFATTADGASSPTERMRIDSSGNVGIGLAPTGKLDIKTIFATNAASNGAIRVENFNTNTQAGWIHHIAGMTITDNLRYGNAGNYVPTTTAGSIMQLESGNIKFYTNSGLTAGTSFTPSIRMTIDPSGNVGIGTSSPSSYGKFAVVGTAGQLFSVTDSMTGSIFTVNDISGIPSIEVLDSGIVKLAQYDGNVLVGTGTDNGIDKVQVKGSIGLVDTATSNIAPLNDTISTITFEKTLTGLGNVTEIGWKPDGTKFYTCISTDIKEYTCVTPWDVAGATNTATLSLAAIDTSTNGFFFSPDGTKLVLCGTTAVANAIVGSAASEDRAYYLTLGTAWDLTTTTLVSSLRFALSDAGIPEAETSPQAIDFNNDGTIMYMLGDTNNKVYQYTLSTAYDVSTATYSKQFSVSTYATGGLGLQFNDDGTRMYVLDNALDRIVEYRLTVAWDVTTAVYYDRVYVGFQEQTPQGLHIEPAQNKAYVAGSTSDSIHQYVLSTQGIEISVETPTSRINLDGDVRIKDSTLYVDGNITTPANMQVYGALTVNSNFSLSGDITVGGNDVNIGSGTAAAGLFAGITTGALSIATSETSGTITIGGTAGTGNILLGRSTSASGQNIYIGASGNRVVYGINAAVAAAGTTQGTATAVNATITNVTTGTGGVVLPTAVAGMRLLVRNGTGSAINIYPAASGVINALGANNPYSLAAGGVIELFATTTTQWYTF